MTEMTTPQAYPFSIARNLLAAISIALSGAVLPLEASLPNVTSLSASGSRSHTVVKGDTLNKLSRRYGVAIEAIRQANGVKGDVIRLGETLMIPAKSGTAISDGGAAERGKTKFHVVVKGDYLARIGRRYGVTVKELQQWNGLNSSTIFPGQSLRVVAPENGGADSSAKSSADRAGENPSVDDSGRIAPPPLSPQSFPTPRLDGEKMEPQGDEETTEPSPGETPGFPRQGGADLAQIAPADRLRVQVFLDNELFAPGKVDGAIGEFTEKAAKRWLLARGYLEHRDPMRELVEVARSRVGDLYASYQIRPEDLARVGWVAASIPGKAKQGYLPYASLAEVVAERFHTDERMLARLNPATDIRAIAMGTKLTVPRVGETFDSGTDVPGAPSGSSSNQVVIVWTENILEVRDPEGALVASFPVTLGNSTKHVRSGTWRIGNYSAFPSFRWDAGVLESGVRSEKCHLLPPGPNNLVGVVWMGLKKPEGTLSHVGIHGTDRPATIGRAESAGCIRLANWDVVRLGRLINLGSPVTWSRF